jgi:hypothetical protein
MYIYVKEKKKEKNEVKEGVGEGVEVRVGVGEGVYIRIYRYIASIPHI